MTDHDHQTRGGGHSSYGEAVGSGSEDLPPLCWPQREANRGPRSSTDDPRQRELGCALSDRSMCSARYFVSKTGEGGSAIRARCACPRAIEREADLARRERVYIGLPRLAREFENAVSISRSPRGGVALG